MAKQYAIMCNSSAHLVSKVCVYYRNKLSARQLLVESAVRWTVVHLALMVQDMLKVVMPTL